MGERSSSHAESSSNTSLYAARNFQQLFCADHGLNFSVVSVPVPCSVCKISFSTREEQCAHYKTDDHVRQLRKQFAQYWGNDIGRGAKHLSREPRRLVENAVDREIIVRISDSGAAPRDSEFETESSVVHDSMITRNQVTVFYCGTCGQYFHSDGALRVHQLTKKHSRMLEQQKTTTSEARGDTHDMSSEISAEHITEPISQLSTSES